MKWSEDTAELDKRLAEVQVAMKPWIKEAKGHGWDYATLESLNANARKELGSRGVTVIQGIDTINDERQVVTRLAHANQWIVSYFPFIPDEGSRKMNKVQMAGSGSTYCRRYGLQAALGMAPMTQEEAQRYQEYFGDDDGIRSGNAPDDFGPSALHQLLGIKEPSVFSGTLLMISNRLDDNNEKGKPTSGTTIIEGVRSMYSAAYEKRGGLKAEWTKPELMIQKAVGQIGQCTNVVLICSAIDLMNENMEQ